jgi:hypothetical protein
MNYWKITNLSTQNAKLIVGTAPNHSKGLVLRPGEFCLSNPKQTPVMDAQIRRKLISVEKVFDNSKYNFKIAEAYNLDILNNLIQEENDKMKEAKVDAENYMNNPE